MSKNKNIIYSQDQILNKYVRTVSHKKIQLLYSAIDLMKENNKLTKFNCIAFAMGYEIFETEPNTFKEIES